MSVETNSKPKDRVSPAEPGPRVAARSSLDVMLSDAVIEDGGVGLRHSLWVQITEPRMK